MDALYTELLQPPTKLGIIGSGCSLATEPTAQISHYYNITHVRSVVSFITLEELSNRTRFRNYFQLLPTDADLAFGFFGIITRFKWKRVAILLQEERLFEVVSAPNGSHTVVSRASASISAHVATTFQGINVATSFCSHKCMLCPGYKRLVG